MPSVQIKYEEPQAHRADERIQADTIVGMRRVFYGIVTSNVAGAIFPRGFAVTALGSGAYDITHNFNTTEVAVLATPKGATNVAVRVSSQDSTTVRLTFSNLAGTGTDTDFTFQLIL